MSFTIELYPKNLITISTEDTLTATAVIDNLNLSCSGIIGDRARFSHIPPKLFNTLADGPFKLWPTLWQIRWPLAD